MRARWILALALFFPWQVAAADLSFAAKDFPQVKPLLCPQNTCQLESFTVVGGDLKGDGQIFWLFYGPSVECGAHGNCPLVLLQKQEEKWMSLSSENCPSEDCLNFGNPTFSQILKTSHQGMRDLSISSDSGSFFWVKDVYEWSGRQYLRKKGGTTYFFYDSDKERLVQVSKVRYESCVKTGKNCL